MALNIPTAAELRALSRVDFTRYGFGEPATPGEQADPLTAEIASAVEYIEQVTGREPLTDVPDTLDALALRAIEMRVAQQVFQSQPDQAATAADDMIVSFSAGSYSETRRDHSEKRYVNTWPALEELLWLLMTDDKREEWEGRLTGLIPAESEIQEIWPSDADPASYGYGSWGGGWWDP